MKRCNNCLMADTKPGVKLNAQGICPACVHAEMKKSIDYNKRFEELKEICSKYKRKDGYYDCVIAVSGGKDSHFQVHTFKNVLGMNPLLVSVGDPFSKTKAGEHNIQNIGRAFNCDLIGFQLSPDLIRRMMRIAFEEFGSPTWPVDRAIYCFPIRTAINFKIPLVIYGENVSWEYGGVLDASKESYSAIDQINNDVAKKVDFSLWYKNGIKDSELNMLKYPSLEEIKAAKLDPIFLSYFVKWNGYHNYQIAKQYGFKDLAGEWKRQGYIDDYDQIDSIAYLINVWLKYPKFGFGRATDVVGYWIRSERITKEQGSKLIRENDHLIDQRILYDFLNYTGYSVEEFYKIVDKFYNPDLFEKNDGVWQLKSDGL